MLLGCAGSLACAIGSLSSLISGRVGRLNRLMLVLSAIALMSAAGLRSLVEVGYPLLGWLSALALTSLALLRETPAGGQSRCRPERTQVKFCKYGCKNMSQAL